MPPKKKVAAIVKIAINAGAATPAPPVGTALGPHGVNIMEFVKAYNARTEGQRGTIVPAEITIFEDRTFTFIGIAHKRQRVLVFRVLAGAQQAHA